MSRPRRAFGTAGFEDRQSRGIPALAAAAASLAAIAALTTTVRGQGCQYTISAIIQGPECGILGFPPTFGTALSDNGEVVGWYTACTIGTDEAFYWSEKTGFVTLDRPSGVYAAMASDISNEGTIVGTYRVTDIGFRGFIYDLKTGVWTEIEPPEVHAYHVVSASDVDDTARIDGFTIIGGDAGSGDDRATLRLAHQLNAR